MGYQLIRPRFLSMIIEKWMNSHTKSIKKQKKSFFKVSAKFIYLSISVSSYFFFLNLFLSLIHLFIRKNSLAFHCTRKEYNKLQKSTALHD